MKRPVRQQPRRTVRVVGPKRPPLTPRRARGWRRRFRLLFRRSDGNRRLQRATSATPRRRFRPRLAGLRSAFVQGLLCVVVFAAAAALPAGVLLTYRYLLTAPHFLLQRVEVGGNERLTAEELMAVAGLDRPVNTLTIEDAAIGAAIRANEWVRSVQVETLLPQRMRILVRERKPAALLALGHVYMVDDRGELFRRVRPDEQSRLPLLTGFDRSDFTDPGRQPVTRARLREALAVLRAWTKAGLDQALPLAELNCHAVYGYTARTAAEGTEVWLGDGNYDAKLRRLVDVLADLNLRGQAARVVYLDGPDALARVTVKADSPPPGPGANAVTVAHK